MTLAEIQKLRLRQNLGGYAEPLTDQHVLTLEELLSAAKGRITINLDVKSPIYAEVVHAVLRAGDADLVTVKTRTGLASPALAAAAPFDRVPFIPVLQGASGEIAEVAEHQATAAHPIAFELPHIASNRCGQGGRGRATSRHPALQQHPGGRLRDLDRRRHRRPA